jgi:putative Mg2+ transporter-C (MgtC) family protein
MNIFDLHKEIDILFYSIPKLVIATICGAIVGWEREKKNKVAGLRTIILICAGSAIFTIGSFLASEIYHLSDPTRILSTIVTGIGFLGGGVILRNDDKVIGLTTAAFIWTISAIGILCGMGFILTPIILTIGLVAVSSYFEGVERFIKQNNEKKDNENRN